MNKLYYGDCLDVLKELCKQYPQGFIDLIYIDPPFNSKRDYNVLFESIDLKDATAQRQAFADTWSNITYIDSLANLQDVNLRLYKLLSNLESVNISRGSISYLTMIGVRICYMHRLLKDSGNFFLHCDPAMSHYIKIICDIVFGETNFRNEIIWERNTDTGSSKAIANKFPSNHDVILFYRKSSKSYYNKQYFQYDESYLKSKFIENDNDGKGLYRWQVLKTFSKDTFEELKRNGLLKKTANSKYYYYKQYLTESKGVRIPDIWKNDDIVPLGPSSDEALGYPTQKPESLLERIIDSTTVPNDIVADFFCGCGTTIAVAQRLHRKWIGVDISHLAVKLMLSRLLEPHRKNRTRYERLQKSIEVNGFPKDVASAKELALEPTRGRFKFQDWIIEVMIGGVSNPKKTADSGWDGYLTFRTDKSKEVVLIEVKSGHVTVKNIREFIQVIDKQNASMGIFVCFLDEVTKEMSREARSHGYYDQEHFQTLYPKVQILTVEELLDGREPKIPESIRTTFKRANKGEAKSNNGQFDLL